MTMQFFYEDGQGNVVDEHDRPEPMDYVVDEELFAFETTEDARKDVDVHLKEASANRTCTLYTDQEKARFFKLMFEKCLSASAAAKQLGIHVRTAQRWAKQYKQHPESVFEKRNKNSRPRILKEEHKKVLLEYIDENPSAVLEPVMEWLFQKFEGT